MECTLKIEIVILSVLSLFSLILDCAKSYCLSHFRIVRLGCVILCQSSTQGINDSKVPFFRLFAILGNSKTDERYIVAEPTTKYICNVIFVFGRKIYKLKITLTLHFKGAEEKWKIIKINENYPK